VQWNPVAVKSKYLFVQHRNRPSILAHRTLAASSLELPGCMCRQLAQAKSICPILIPTNWEMDFPPPSIMECWNA
jgi:hypothetical protein